MLLIADMFLHQLVQLFSSVVSKLDFFFKIRSFVDVVYAVFQNGGQ